MMQTYIRAYIYRWLVPMLFGTTLFLGCSVHSSEINYLAEGEVEHTLVMYLLADNNLSSSIYNNALDAEEGMIGASPASRLVIYLDRADGSTLYELRYLPYGGGDEHIRYCKELKTYPRQASTTPEVMKSVMEDILRLAPSRTYGLVLSGHGTGWFPKPIVGVGYDKQEVAPYPAASSSTEYFFDLWRENPQTRAYGYDYALGDDGKWSSRTEDSYMVAEEFIEGLSPIHFDYIIFDACFMSSVELLYSLRSVTDYIVASPVEILSEGLPYVEIVQSLMKHTSNINSLGSVAMDVYMRDDRFTSKKSLALTMIDCSRLEALSDAVAAIYASTGASDCVSLVEQKLSKAKITANGTPAQEGEVYMELPYWEGVQPLDRMRPAGFHDLEDFIYKLTDDEQLLSNFDTALDDAIVWTLHTEDIYSEGYSLDGMAYGGSMIEYKVGGKLDLCGISTYIPIREAPKTLSYYLQTDWAKKVYSLP